MSSDLLYAKFRHYPTVHLFERQSKECLCGIDRDGACVSSLLFRGWPMCAECKAERDKRMADEKAAAVKRKAEEAKNWWMEAKRVS